jgi:hypothetical protein
VAVTLQRALKVLKQREEPLDVPVRGQFGLGVAVHAYNHSTQEGDAGGP